MKRRDFLIPATCASLMPGQVFAFSFLWRKNEQYDVIVIGAGAAGLAAALRSAQLGMKVIVLEARSMIGGTTALSAGMFNAVNPKYQAPLGISDSEELFFSQTMQSGADRNDPAVVRAMVYNSCSTMGWLEENGVNFYPQPFKIYGSPVRRSFRPASDRGAGYVEVLYNRCKQLGVTFRRNSQFKNFKRDSNGSIIGIQFLQKGQLFELIPSKGIVLAAGGFIGNQRLLKKWAPKLAGLPCEGGSISTGYVLEEAIKCGAATKCMEYIECVPEGSLYEGNVRLSSFPDAMIFINEKGERFVDETGHRMCIQEAIINHLSGKIYTVTSEDNVKKMDLPTQRNLHKSLLKKQAVRADTIEDLAKMINVSNESLLQSFNSVNAPQNPPYWALAVFMRLHFSLGGLVINPEGRCVMNDGKLADCLWAAGQICGNVHGSNRLGGNGLCEAFVFGKLSAESIAGTIS